MIKTKSNAQYLKLNLKIKNECKEDIPILGLNE